MRTVRLALVGAIVLGLTAAARADEKKGDPSEIQKKLVGKWEVAKFTGTKGGPPPGATFEFTKDGKLLLIGEQKGEKVRMEATYKVRGKVLTLTAKYGDKYKTDTANVVKVDDNELVLSHENEEGELTLKRKKP